MRRNSESFSFSGLKKPWSSYRAQSRESKCLGHNNKPWNGKENHTSLMRPVAVFEWGHTMIQITLSWNSRIAKNNLKFLISLPLPCKCWDWRCMALCLLVYTVLGLNPGFLRERQALYQPNLVSTTKFGNANFSRLNYFYVFNLT